MTLIKALYFSTVKRLHHVGYTRLSVYLQFFTWLFVLYERPSGQNDIFQLRCDNKDLQLLRCSIILPLLSDLSTRRSQHAGFLFYFIFLPLAFIPAGETSTKHAPPVSPAQLPVGVLLTFEEGLLLSAPWFLYRLYMQNGCRSNFFNSTLYGLAVESLLTSDVCTRETHRRNVFFSLYFIWTEGPVSLWVSVCVYKPSVRVSHLKRGTLLLYVW